MADDRLAADLAREPGGGCLDLADRAVQISNGLCLRQRTGGALAPVDGAPHAGDRRGGGQGRPTRPAPTIARLGGGVFEAAVIPIQFSVEIPVGWSQADVRSCPEGVTGGVRDYDSTGADL